MIHNVQINANTAAGQKLIKELRRYPDAVQFIEPNIVTDSILEGYVLPKDGFDEVRSHILINSDTEIGKTLLHKLESQRQIVKIEYPYPTNDYGMEIEALSAKESAKLAFQKLGEKYNRTFDNKYTQ